MVNGFQLINTRTESCLFYITYLLHYPTVEQVTVHRTVFIFHGQYWIIIGEYCPILSDNVKQMNTAGLNSLGDVIVRIV